MAELIGIGAAGQGIDRRDPYGPGNGGSSGGARRWVYTPAPVRVRHTTRTSAILGRGAPTPRYRSGPVRPARLLVFDDATSSLDMATELDVMTAVEEARAGRTMLTVTQRVTTAARADLVIWLEEGRVKGLRDLTRNSVLILATWPLSPRAWPRR